MLRSRPFAGQSLDFMDREQRVEARSARMANLAEIRRAAPGAARGVITRVLGAAPAQPKEDVSQSGAYMTAAKALGYCMRCDKKVVPLTGELDFCHADLGKGQGFKTDVRRGWPGCRGCHEFVSRELPRAVRRAVEYLLGLMTRAAVRAAGTWPKSLEDLS
jgi:hypothetical protein